MVQPADSGGLKPTAIYVPHQLQKSSFEVVENARCQHCSKVSLTLQATRQVSWGLDVWSFQVRLWTKSSTVHIPQLVLGAFQVLLRPQSSAVFQSFAAL